MIPPSGAALSGARPTLHNRFRQWRDAGVFEALPEGLIAETAKRGEVDLSLAGIDSTTALEKAASSDAPGAGRRAGSTSPPPAGAARRRSS